MDKNTASVERIYENIWHAIKNEDDGDCISSVASILAYLIHKTYPTTYEDVLPFLSSKMVDNIKGIDKKEGRDIKIDKEPVPDEQRIYSEIKHVIKHESIVSSLTAVTNVLGFLIHSNFPADYPRVMKKAAEMMTECAKKIDKKIRERKESAKMNGMPNDG
jgi:hypothetical protein